MTLQEIAELVGGTIFPPEATKDIIGIASLRDANEGDLAFYQNSRHWSEFSLTKASAVLVPKEFDEKVLCPVIKVENPSLAFDKVVAKMAPPEIAVSPGIHPQANVAATAIIGENVSLGAFVVVEEGAVIGKNTIISAHSYIGAYTKIGEDCLLHARVTVRERCILGNRVICQPGVVLGSCGFGYLSTKEKGHQKIPQTGIVQIEDDVEIGANTTIDRARFGRTVIGHGTKIDNLVQIAHNVVLGPHNMICAQVGISGSTRTGVGVTLAGQVGLSGHIEIGDRAIIGAQSGISKNVPEDVVLIGSPGKPITTWKKNNFYLHNLGKLFERVKVLEKLFSEKEE